MKKDLAAYGRIVNKWCRKKETYALLIADLLRDRYLSELRRDFLASVGITYAVFRIAKSRLRQFGEFC
jgi:hypothetical protein